MEVEAEMEAEYTVDIGGYENTVNTSVFLNRTPPAYPDDSREVFRIIEVIPHDICSLFPYLVEWGSEEEYNNNVPIGYDGLLEATVGASSQVSLFAQAGVASANGRPYIGRKNYFKRDYLTYYTNNVGENGWGRETDNSVDGIITTNGYFEYVGNGLGLYNINTGILAGGTQTGINYEMRAINRKGSESPKGNFYVDAPAYYLSSKHSGIAKPDFNGDTIVSQTGYNYNLSFQHNSLGAYRADPSKIIKKSSTISAEGYDYFLTIDTAQGDINDWGNGFEYYKNGNYGVLSVAEVTDGTKLGTYVRKADTANSDGYTGGSLNLAAGHFVPYDTSYSDSIQRYKVTFAVSSSGSYAATGYTNPTDWENVTGCYFTYAGAGKGQYDVSFMYAPSGVGNVRYEPDLLTVEHNKGGYCLTSTVKNADGTPIYKEEDGSGNLCDYSQIIMNIGFTDGTTSAASPGVTNGGDSGSWVFRAVADSTEMEETDLRALYQKTGFSAGTKIYVTNQSRRRRYYVKDGFVNTEWFKLLCFATHPSNGGQPYTVDVDGDGKYYKIDWQTKVEDNLYSDTSQKIIEVFDNTYRIEILQRTPGALTEAEVRSADLIFISNTFAFEGMQLKWGDISKYRTNIGLSALAPYNGESDLAFKDDFSASVMYAIYDECIYKKSCAIMLNSKMTLMGAGSTTSSNVEKLFLMTNFFADDINFAWFMPWYSEYRNDNYTRMLKNGSVQVLKNTENGSNNNRYNFAPPLEDSEEIQNWDREYFRIFDNGNLVYGTWDRWLYNGESTVANGSTKYITPQYVASIFQSASNTLNIWKILHNRTREDTSSISVIVTNADTLRDSDSNPTKVIYADEFDPKSFDVKYEVHLLDSNGKVPDISSITVQYMNGETLTTIDTKSAPLNYNEEYASNVRSAFTQGKSADITAKLDPSITMQKITITATASNGKSGSADVYVVVREAFDLN